MTTMETMGQAGYPATGGGLWTGSEEDVVFLCTGCAAKFGSARQPSSCPHCGATGKTRDFPTFETSRIANQNDHFRVTLGMDAGIRGKIVLTLGVQELMDEYGAEILLKLSQYSEFSEDNDPWGARDFGTITVGRPGAYHRLYWKIDLFDLAYESGSEAPSDTSQTRRVLTLLLPSEY
jgi:hypothetical protein